MLSARVNTTNGSVLCVEKKTAVLKHEYQVTGKSILEENGYSLYPAQPDKPVGIPSVVRAITDTKGFCYFNRKWQLYSFELIKMRVKEAKPSYSLYNVDFESRKIFAAMYRDDAFQSNKFGTKTCHDYINGTNEDAEDIKLFPVFTGGCTVEITGETKTIAGSPCFPVRCFDGSKPPPDPLKVNWHTDTRVMETPYIETRIATATGGREVRPFDFRGVSRIPFFVLRDDNDIAWINDYRVK